MFIARGKEDALVTKNLVPGESVYGEKRISVEVCASMLLLLLLRRRVICHSCSPYFLQTEGVAAAKVEYRVWNPFRSKLAAAILGGVEKIHIQPGSKVLYLGAASGTTVSHVADIVGPVSVAEP